MAEPIDWSSLAHERAKSGHALLGPSKLPRLMRCPGSLRMAHEAGVTDKETVFAIEGSQAHMLAEMVLTTPDSKALDWLGQDLVLEKGGKSHPFTVSSEMAEAVQRYVDWCQELPGIHFTETRVSLDRWMPLPDQFGTTDHGAIHGHVMTVTDLKYGMGERVYAEWNEQALGYALGLYDEWSWAFDIREIVVRIAQPRLDHFDVFKISVEELLAFGERLLEKMHEVLSLEPSLEAGTKQCRFCPMSGRCAVERQSFLDLVGGDFDGFESVEVSPTMAIDQLVLALEKRALVKHWLKRVESVAIEMLLRGAAVGDWKVVETQTHRKFENEKAAAAALLEAGLGEADIYEPRSLVTPAAVERQLKSKKKLKKKEVEEFLAKMVTRPRGRAVLAPLSDKREALKGGSSDFSDFENLEDGD